MKKNQNDIKVLFPVIVLTIITLGIILSNLTKKQKIESSPEEVRPSEEKILQTETESVSLSESAVEEGIFLEVQSPSNGATVTDYKLVVSGITAANAEVFINESELTADSQGNFSITITLEEGENIVVITVSDEDGNYTEKELTVTYEP